MSQESIEIYDDQNVALGLVKPRRRVHEDGDWHRTAQVYVLNPQGELLCHQRHPDKDLFPLLWDVSIGGHLAPGETYESCAQRELEEELGVAVPVDDLTFVSVVTIDGGDWQRHLIDREHAGVFAWQTDRAAADFNYQRDEIVQLKFLPLTTVKTYLQTEPLAFPFIPLQTTFLRIIGLIEAQLGRPVTDLS